jgi:hypothetical protein
VIPRFESFVLPEQLENRYDSPYLPIFLIACTAIYKASANAPRKRITAAIGLELAADRGDDFLGIGLRAQFGGGYHGLNIGDDSVPLNLANNETNDQRHCHGNNDVHELTSKLLIGVTAFWRGKDVLRKS